MWKVGLATVHVCSHQAGELDTSYIAAMAPGVKTLVANPNISSATESGEGYGAALLSFLVDLNTRDQLPHVLSMCMLHRVCGAQRLFQVAWFTLVWVM